MPENNTESATVTSPTKEFDLIDTIYPVGVPLAATYKR